MNIESGNVITLDNDNEYLIIDTYKINEKNIGEIVLFENVGEQIRVVKDKEEIDEIINKISEEA